MADKTYYVYVLTCNSRRLYIGVTNNLMKRLNEHKTKVVKGFTARYNLSQLVYYEQTPDVLSAIAREKQLKSWSRAKKIALIESMNPEWKDLLQDWTSR